jgi:protease IV
MADGHSSRGCLWFVLGFCSFFLFILIMGGVGYFAFRPAETEETVVWKGGSDKIGEVEIEGVILSPVDSLKQLRKLAEDKSVKGIVLRLNTPGGGAAASEEIYRGVRRIRDEKIKPIVADIETVGASGGYYVASGADKIYANNASIVGSIGVIAEWYSYADLLQWAKMKNVVIKTGEFKDVGNPARPMTPAEQAFLQQLIDNMKGQFVAAVADGRHQKPEDINAIADGRVWTGQQALGIHLIDQVGDFRTAVMDTAKMAGIKGEPTLVKIEKPHQTLLDLLFGDISRFIPDKAKLMEQNVGFYYLWK